MVILKEKNMLRLFDVRKLYGVEKYTFPFESKLMNLINNKFNGLGLLYTVVYLGEYVPEATARFALNNIIAIIDLETGEIITDSCNENKELRDFMDNINISINL